MHKRNFRYIYLPILLTTCLVAHSETIKIGILSDTSGPVAELGGEFIEIAQSVVDEINSQGGIGPNNTLELFVYDSGCNPEIAVPSAEKAMNDDKVLGMVGPLCSGSVAAVGTDVSAKSGVVIISPSGTSPTLAQLDDKDTVFRTALSGADQAAFLAAELKSLHLDNVAVSYIDNLFGESIADEFRQAFEAINGTITAMESHPDDGSDHSDHFKLLAESDANALLVIDIASGNGSKTLKSAIDGKYFDVYFGIDDMQTSEVIETVGTENLGNYFTINTIPISSYGRTALETILSEQGKDINRPYYSNLYDATFLLALAIEKANGKPDQIIPALREVSAPPGEPVYPGEWEAAKKLIAEGKDIDYEGGSGQVNFNELGDVEATKSNYGLYKVSRNQFELLKKLQ